MRQILQKTIDGKRLVGTYHVPMPSGNGSSPRHGIILFNSGFLPRAPIGDLLVHLADHFAGLGYPTFRFDLPGLGDSEGELPADTQNFFARMTGGAYGRPAGLLACAVAAEYGLSGMILGGLCGGAVTSVFAAAGEGAPICRGILQLDPSFKLVPPLDTSAPRGPTGSRKPKAKPAGWTQRYQKARVAFLQSKFGERTHAIYRACKPAIMWVPQKIAKLRPPTLPDDANHGLINAWIEVGKQGKPMLVFVAGEQEKRGDQFDCLCHVNRTPHRTDMIWVADTTHAFVEGSGVTVAKRESAIWLQRHFPAA